MKTQSTVVGLLAAFAVFNASADVLLAPGESIQEAVNAAEAGERIVLAEGTYEGDVDFRGKRLTIIGAGSDTIIRGSGGGPVITFANGEGRGSVVDSVTVTGGGADDGGGILIVKSSPRVQRVVIFDNQAKNSGAGIYVRGRGSRPLIRNNVLAYNFDPRPQATSDAHQIFVDSGARAMIVNNTIVRGNGNGIFLQSSGERSSVLNNLLVRNGSRLASGAPTGRGLCDLSGSARILNNVFYRNDKAAVLTGSFVDYARVGDAEGSVGESRFRDNVDGDPRFRRQMRSRVPRVLDVSGLVPRRNGAGRDAGLSPRRLRDRDGSANDVGHTGGPLGWR